MSRNIGTIDRAIRVVVGIALLALVFTGPHTAWGWIGVIPLATGLVGFCPMYSILHRSTYHPTRA